MKKGVGRKRKKERGNREERSRTNTSTVPLPSFFLALFFPFPSSSLLPYLFPTLLYSQLPPPSNTSIHTMIVRPLPLSPGRSCHKNTGTLSALGISRFFFVGKTPAQNPRRCKTRIQDLIIAKATFAFYSLLFCHQKAKQEQKQQDVKFYSELDIIFVMCVFCFC